MVLRGGGILCEVPLYMSQFVGRPLGEDRFRTARKLYRGASLIITPPPVGPDSSPMPRNLW